MIYPYIRVPIPELGGYIGTNGKRRYLYVYVGERLVNKSGKSTHPKSRAIGRIEVNKEGKEELMPNTAYYEVMGLPQPELAVQEGAGRKPYKQSAPSLKERKDFAEYALGYGVSILLLSTQIGLLSALERAFGETRTQQILTLAAYLCEESHSSLAGLGEFIDEHFALFPKLKFDRRQAGQLLVELGKAPELRGKFYTEWIKQAGLNTRYFFYDVTSFSTYSGNIERAHFGYNRDHEDLVQINEGLLCDRQTSLPLFMCSYDGSLNDAQNFNYALEQARAHHLCSDENKMTVVIDGGFSSNNYDWLHFNGYGLIAGVSCDRRKDVRTAYLKWTESLNDSAYANLWTLGEKGYLSSRVPLTIGNLDGLLIMYRDVDLHAMKTKQLSRVKTGVEARLKGYAGRIPEQVKNFDDWASSFKPYFKVRKKGRTGFEYEFDTQAYQEACSLCGKVTVFVSSDTQGSDSEIMQCYRQKESVEDCFDTTKNGLSDKRLHVHGDAQVDGKLFVMFIALILRRTLHQRLKDYLRQHDLTDEEAIRALQKVVCYKYNKFWQLKDAISKQQREILTELKLSFSATSETVAPQQNAKHRVKQG